MNKGDSEGGWEVSVKMSKSVTSFVRRWELQRRRGSQLSGRLSRANAVNPFHYSLETCQVEWKRKRREFFPRFKTLFQFNPHFIPGIKHRMVTLLLLWWRKLSDIRQHNHWSMYFTYSYILTQGLLSKRVSIPTKVWSISGHRHNWIFVS